MGWAHNFKPGKGPASGIPAGGVGRGGDKRTWDRAPFSSDNQPANPVRLSAERQAPPEHKSIGHMEAKTYREQLRARREKQLKIIDKIFDRALAEEASLADLVAADRRIEINDNRVDGQAKQVIETQEDTRSDDEIRAEIARRQKELGV